MLAPRRDSNLSARRPQLRLRLGGARTEPRDDGFRREHARRHWPCLGVCRKSRVTSRKGLYASAGREALCAAASLPPPSAWRGHCRRGRHAERCGLGCRRRRLGVVVASWLGEIASGDASTRDAPTLRLRWTVTPLWPPAHRGTANCCLAASSAARMRTASSCASTAKDAAASSPVLSPPPVNGTGGERSARLGE
jgi:hypothetical protein